MITAGTRLIALLGHPVDHSLSPLLQNAALQVHGVPAVYLAFDVPPARLPDAVQGLRALGAAGANVTLPHKQAVIPLLDALDAEAERIGAVNTIVNRQGQFVGYNTDAPGFLAALHSRWKGDLSSAAVLLLGAGGAARAGAAALMGQGVKELLIWNRTGRKAAALCQACEAWGPGSCRVVPSEELAQAAGRVDILVNATSAGLAAGASNPEIKELEQLDDIYRQDLFVMDLRYGTRTLAQTVAERGVQAMDGWEMLVRQAGMSFALWTGLQAPLDQMRAAVQGAA